MAKDKPASFTIDDAKRISTTVRRVESDPRVGRDPSKSGVAFDRAILIGKTDASHAKGASGTVSIWTGDPGSEVDSTRNVTAYNRFADVASGKWVAVANNGFGWYLIAAEC